MILGVDITPEDFKSGKMFVAYDASGDMCNSFHTHSLKNGNIGCEFSFKTALNKPIMMIVYSVYHMQLVLDKDRNAKLEYIV